MKVRILGSGTSSGVPRIGNDWGSCDPTNPRNRRTRASILIESATTRILVDTGPDMRAQLLAARTLATVDAVIWTHDHADHTHGIDDLRQVFHALGHPVRGVARPKLMAQLTNRFGYIFSGLNGYPKVASLEQLTDRIQIGDITVNVADQPHGETQSAGLRFEAEQGAIGYATDLSGMTERMIDLYGDLGHLDRGRPSHPAASIASRPTNGLALDRAAEAAAGGADPHGSVDGLRRTLPDFAAWGRAGL